jgi:hypothetical protein
VLKPGDTVVQTKLLGVVDYLDDGDQHVSISIGPCSSTDRRFDFASWKGSRANSSAWNKDYAYPVVEGWLTSKDNDQAIALQGQSVVVTGRHFDKVKVACVYTVDVSCPPVWRVSLILRNLTAADGTGSLTEDHFEVELRSRAAKDWFKQVTGEEYRPNLYLGSCPVAVKVLRSRRAGAPVAEVTLGTPTRNLTFRYMALGQPSSQPRAIPHEAFLGQVRACVLFLHVYVRACVLFLHVYRRELRFWQTLHATEDYPADELNTNSHVNFTLVVIKVQPFNYSRSGRRISFISPELPEEALHGGVGMTFLTVDGAVSQQESMLIYTSKVHRAVGSSPTFNALSRIRGTDLNFAVP